MRLLTGFTVPSLRALRKLGIERSFHTPAKICSLLTGCPPKLFVATAPVLKGTVRSATRQSLVLRSKSVLGLRACSTDAASDIEQRLRVIVATHPVVVFSKTWCGFCAQVKSLFRELGVPARVIELDDLGNEGLLLQDALYSWTGQRTVPNVFVGGKHIGGCSDTLEAYERGELQSWIEEAKQKSPSP
jgi:glutaredoxin